jgi:alanine racemase
VSAGPAGLGPRGRRQPSGASTHPGAEDRSPSIEDRLSAAGLPVLPRTAWLEIDLDAIVANLGVLREAAGSAARTMPVVKADAYGHGAVPVAWALERAGADGLAVATLDEALELREAGVGLPILVLFPIPPELAGDAARAHVAVAVGGGPLLDRVLAAAAQAAAEGGPQLEVHLEVETGLGRGGVVQDQVAAAAAAIRRAPGVRLGGIWSHLAEVTNPEVTSRQDAAFAQLLGPVLAGSVDSPQRSLAATGGLLGRRAGSYDAIRPGLSVYGLVPEGLPVDPGLASLAARLRPALRLCARPVRVVDLPAGHGVSYGPGYVTRRPSRIATLPVGYGDGWRRNLSDRAMALVRGRRVPLVGRVAMDAVMADVTDVPGAPIDEADEFVLIGTQASERIDVTEVSALGGTIAYEVVTAMARRLPRVYDAAGTPVGIRTLVAGRAGWLASNSGTATSATSRSTRS